jgi:hypothetical protein
MPLATRYSKLLARPAAPLGGLPLRANALAAATAMLVACESAPSSSGSGTTPAATTARCEVPTSTPAVPPLSSPSARLDAPSPPAAVDDPTVGARLFEVHAPGDRGLHLACLIEPANYTFLIFTTKHCIPCDELWSEMPRWIAGMRNVVAVKVDVTDVEAGDGVALLADSGLEKYPASFLLHPSGEVLKKVSGADEARRVLDSLKNRPAREPVNGYDGPSCFLNGFVRRASSH